MRKLLFSLSLGILGLLGGNAGQAFGVACKIAVQHPPSKAEIAFFNGDYDKAVALYSDQLKDHPDTPPAVAGLVGALLRQQKVAEAADAVQKGMNIEPSSAVLLAAQAEVLYRQGTPWLAGKAVTAAMQIDPCLPRSHLMLARLFRLNSLYASEQRELRTAHQLDPFDPAIQSAWIGTLSTSQQIAELEAYLASPTGDDPDDIRHMKMYLETLKKRESEPHKSCRLVSSATSTEIPFVLLMRDATHIRAFGLEVKLNDQKSRLEIDTGASGLVISRSVAEHAGLKPFSTTELGGIGDKGEKSGYTAYADKLQIGALEFHDCVVRVIDSKNVVDVDGLIGMDVFSRFLVTLDFPMRKLQLGPLPPRPGEAGPQTPALETRESSDQDSSAASGDKSPDGDDNGAVTAKAAPAASSAPKGPQDRYIAPEMATYTKIYRIGHDLLIPTQLNQSEMQRLFILDTGSWSTALSPAVAREVTKVHSDDTLTVKGVSGSVQKVYEADEVTFRFANLKQTAENVASFDTSNISKNIGLEVSGLIGANTLTQVTMHVDYRDGLVKFDYDPNRGYRSYH